MQTSKAASDIAAEGATPAADETAPPLPPGSRDIGSLRIPYVRQLVWALAALSVGWLVYGARNFDFYYDEWDWVEHSAHWTLNDYLVPHVVHWSTVPMLIYKVLFQTVGMHSYLPFLAAMAIMHAAGGLVLFALLRRSGGDVLAFACTLIFLFLGTGAQDLDWAFQLGFDCSVTFGLLGVYLLTAQQAGRWRQVGGLVALLLGLSSSGIGLFYCLWVGVDNLLQKDRRRRLWAVGVALLIFVAWYAHWGRIGVARTDSTLLSLRTLKLDIGYVPLGVGNVVAGVFGRSSDYAGLLLPLAVGAVALLFARYRPISPLAWGAVAALVGGFAITGSGRAQYGIDEALQSRYVCIAAPFFLMIVTEALRRFPASRHFGVPVFATVVTIALAGNLTALHKAQQGMMPGFKSQKDELEAAWLFRNAPGLDRNAVIVPGQAPTLTVEGYVSSREQYGTPLRTVTLAQLADDKPVWINTVMRNIMPLREAILSTAPPAAQTCTAISPSGGSVTLSVPGGATVYLTPAGTDPVKVQYWYESDAAGYGGTSQTVAWGTTLAVTVPDTGLGLSWKLSLTSGAAAQICR